MKRKGFTLIELICVMALLMAMSGVLYFVFSTCFRSWSAAVVRAKTRTELAQTLELVTNDLRRTLTVDAISATSITYTMDGANHYRFYRYSPAAGSYSLLRGAVGDPDEQGSVLVTGVQEGAIFTQLATGFYQIDLALDNDGEVVHMRTKVRARNL